MKYGMLVFSFLLLISVINAKAQTVEYNSCMKDIIIEDVNIDRLYDYLINNDYADNVVRICSSNYCYALNNPVLTKSIAIFREKYINYLKYSGNEQLSEQAAVQGFKINRITVDICK